MILACNPFAPGEAYDWMWGCCAGTHASSQWQTNGNDLYAVAGTNCVAPISGRVIRAGVPPIGQGSRVGIQGDTHSVYMAHMTDLVVGEGDYVKAGDAVGQIWAFPGLPDHMHFSLAEGSYGGGRFVDPKVELARTALHVGGRTYRVPNRAPDQLEVKPDPAPYYLEELPWNPTTDQGYGPRVLGPWLYLAGRDRKLTALKINDPDGIYVPMGDGVRYYIYHYRPGTYGRTFRYGGWVNLADRQLAEASISGRLGRRLRAYRGAQNSLYPFI